MTHGARKFWPRAKGKVAAQGGRRKGLGWKVSRAEEVKNRKRLTYPRPWQVEGLNYSTRRRENFSPFCFSPFFRHQRAPWRKNERESERGGRGGEEKQKPARLGILWGEDGNDERNRWIRVHTGTHTPGLPPPPSYASKPPLWSFPWGKLGLSGPTPGFRRNKQPTPALFPTECLPRYRGKYDRSVNAKSLRVGFPFFFSFLFRSFIYCRFIAMDCLQIRLNPVFWFGYNNFVSIKFKEKLNWN